MELKELKPIVEELLRDLNLYEFEPKKTLSKKIRLTLGLIKRVTPELRKELIERDKKQ